jgi:hypothetical protein
MVRCNLDSRPSVNTEGDQQKHYRGTWTYHANENMERSEAGRG